jgi:hypothetical protein
MKKYLVLMIVLILTFLSCEKDDICIENTTPKLIIRFYDDTDRTELKQLNNMFVWVVEYDSIERYNNVTLDSIAIPLNLSEDITKFVIENNAVKDTIEFSYARNDIFVSRSCGYKTIFEELQINTNSLNWIKNTEIINSTIENDTAAHINMYH